MQAPEIELSEERKNLIIQLKRLGSCRSGLQWIRKQPVDLSLRQLWLTCPDGTWLKWLCENAGLSERVKDLRSAAGIRSEVDFWEVVRGLAIYKAFSLYDGEDVPVDDDEDDDYMDWKLGNLVRVTFAFHPPEASISEVAVF